MGTDMVTVVNYFFSLCILSLGVKSNFMVLLPKISEDIYVDQFRPIMLGNFIFKIFTKIISKILGCVVGQNISLNQFGLVKGRQIKDV